MNANRRDDSSLPATLSVGDLLEGYRARRFTVTEVVEHVLDRVAQATERYVWISVLPAERVLAYASALESRSPESLPLYGVPFAIKDNIDLEGVVTTAACPDYAYMPEASAHSVQRLIDAGAIPIGKANLDQFATGLVGTRSPYGACRNSFDQAYISGGSSSGSAVAVATGLVSFSLGTDTAGSGRIPAAFNNIVGLKPTCGRVSTRGVVPACRSIDCVSIFALTADDAARVCAVVEGYDRADAYSRVPEPSVAAAPTLASGPFRFGIPRADQLEFFDDTEYARLFFDSVKRLEQLGGQCVEIDFAPFRTAAKLLYNGAWIAERYDAVGEFIERKPDSVHAITRQLILASTGLTAADAFRSFHRLADAKRAAREAWGDIDVLVTPTAGTIYKIADVEWEPIRLNSNLGFYTNFVNFLDLAAVAVPAGFREDGLPFGITMIGGAWSDESLLRLADRFHRVSVDQAGALGTALPAAAVPPISLAGRNLAGGTEAGRAGEGAQSILVAVCGAHMEGLPLNHQLGTRGATFVQRTRTVPSYRFYALPGGPPLRPGMVRVPSGGASIDVEVWSVPAAHFGSFVAGIPAPLGIGKVDLEDGQQVSGFLCEAHAVEGASDITALGGWRQYLRTR
ncbi:MAG: allophanate hydrolase [Gammaproteobacteria bacterium]